MLSAAKFHSPSSMLGKNLLHCEVPLLLDVRTHLSTSLEMDNLYRVSTPDFCLSWDESGMTVHGN